MDDDGNILYVADVPVLNEDGKSWGVITYAGNRRHYYKHALPIYKPNTSSTAPTRRSRERTASPQALSAEERDPNDPKRKHCLSFRYDYKCSRSQGITFGVGEDCDVQIPIGGSDVSRHHCAITFDDKRRAILRDFSSNGSIVTYDGKCNVRRRYFTWLIGGDGAIRPGTVILLKLRPDLEFQLIIPQYSPKSTSSKNAICKFRELASLNTDVIPIEGLAIHGRRDTVVSSTYQSPSSEGLYLDQEEIASGSFGKVFKVWSVSIGRFYAAKRTTSDYRCRRFLEDEAAILKRLSHEHIIPFVEFSKSPAPCLVLELARGGSLWDFLHQDAGALQQEPVFADEFIADHVLVQTLDALAYLHSQNPPIFHRDIKPDNILFANLYEPCSGRPPHIWLADFGLSKESKEKQGLLATQCGTSKYMAPEVASSIPYSPLADVWSLGVVIMEVAHRLPRDFEKMSWERWCKTLQFKAVSESEKYLDPLRPLIRDMLDVDPKLRLSAETCRDKAKAMCMPRIGERLNYGGYGGATKRSYAGKGAGCLRNQPPPSPKRDAASTGKPSSSSSSVNPGRRPHALKGVRGHKAVCLASVQPDDILVPKSSPPGQGPWEFVRRSESRCEVEQHVLDSETIGTHAEGSFGSQKVVIVADLDAKAGEETVCQSDEEGEEQDGISVNSEAKTQGGTAEQKDAGVFRSSSRATRADNRDTGRGLKRKASGTGDNSSDITARETRQRLDDQCEEKEPLWIRDDCPHQAQSPWEEWESSWNPDSWGEDGTLANGSSCEHQKPPCDTTVSDTWGPSQDDISLFEGNGLQHSMGVGSEVAEVAEMARDTATFESSTEKLSEAP